MLIVDDGIIYVNRGDDFALNVSIKDGAGTAYEMQDGDYLTLTVRALPETGSAVVLEAVSLSERIAVNGALTTDLPAGRYSCDVQLTTADGKRCTVYPLLNAGQHGKVKNWKNFILDPEVTHP